MAKIIIKFNNEVIDHVDLKQGDMKIGRRPGCDIHIDNLAVSGEHANIFTIGEDSFIQDLDSTNGTFLNNKRIAKHHLRNGDQVVIGKFALVYVTEHVGAAAAAPQEDFAKTVIINPAAMPKPQAPTAVSVSAPKSESHGALYVLSGANSGKRIELTKSVTSLGKTGKRTGTILRVAEGYQIDAREADEIPKVNGRPVPVDGIMLKNGDVIEVGGTRLQFLSK